MSGGAWAGSRFWHILQGAMETFKRNEAFRYPLILCGEISPNLGGNRILSGEEEYGRIAPGRIMGGTDDVYMEISGGHAGGGSGE